MADNFDPQQNHNTPDPEKDPGLPGNTGEDNTNTAEVGDLDKDAPEVVFNPEAARRRMEGVITRAKKLQMEADALQALADQAALGLDDPLTAGAVGPQLPPLHPHGPGDATHHPILVPGAGAPPQDVRSRGPPATKRPNNKPPPATAGRGLPQPGSTATANSGRPAASSQSRFRQDPAYRNIVNTMTNVAPDGRYSGGNGQFYTGQDPTSQVTSQQQGYDPNFDPGMPLFAQNQREVALLQQAVQATLLQVANQSLLKGNQSSVQPPAVASPPTAVHVPSPGYAPPGPQTTQSLSAPQPPVPNLGSAAYPPQATDPLIAAQQQQQVAYPTAGPPYAAPPAAPQALYQPPVVPQATYQPPVVQPAVQPQVLAPPVQQQVVQPRLPTQCYSSSDYGDSDGGPLRRVNTSMWKTRFNGKNIELSHYLATLDAVASQQGWDDSVKGSLLLAGLEGDATRVMSSLPKGCTSYDTICTHLKDLFDPEANILAYKSQFLCRMRGPNEDNQEFAVALRVLANKAFPHDNEATVTANLIHQFTAGQPAFLLYGVSTSGHKTLQEAVASAIRLESMTSHAVKPGSTHYIKDQKARANCAAGLPYNPLDLWPHQALGSFPTMDAPPTPAPRAAVASQVQSYDCHQEEDEGMAAMVASLTGMEMYGIAECNAYQTQNRTGQRTCFSCGQPGHMWRDCPAVKQEQGRRGFGSQQQNRGPGNRTPAQWANRPQQNRWQGNQPPPGPGKQNTPAPPPGNSNGT